VITSAYGAGAAIAFFSIIAFAIVVLLILPCWCINRSKLKQKSATELEDPTNYNHAWGRYICDEEEFRINLCLIVITLWLVLFFFDCS